MRRFVDELDWWVLGAKGGPWEYCVETPERFASTMGMNDPYINYGPYMNENKGRFTQRQIKLVYDTMMENTRIVMKMETINKIKTFLLKKCIGLKNLIKIKPKKEKLKIANKVKV